MSAPWLGPLHDLMTPVPVRPGPPRRARDRRGDRALVGMAAAVALAIGVPIGLGALAGTAAFAWLGAAAEWLWVVFLIAAGLVLVLGPAALATFCVVLIVVRGGREAYDLLRQLGQDLVLPPPGSASGQAPVESPLWDDAVDGPRWLGQAVRGIDRV